ncbi:MAG: VWA domain-containing protein [Polyangiaceae bacterium]|nr:VWA domain-containing protein [Polyangiaceae bacterium]
MGTETNVSAAVIIDTSNSMTYSGYVDITKIDSKAFLGCFVEGDRAAVVNYDMYAHVPYACKEVGPVPPGTTIVDAQTTIQNLVFTGGATNIGAGLSTGNAQIQNQPNNRALVLLSDGYNNYPYGSNPLDYVPTTYPVYSCAMGPASDQRLMQNIANKSDNGAYYYAPYVIDMMKIYNQIRSWTPEASLVTNELSQVSGWYYKLEPGEITAGTPMGQFTVAWSDASYTYTHDWPNDKQVSITLVDPDLNTRDDIPWQVGTGFVVFNINDPLPGTWQVQVMYAGEADLGITVGIFEYGMGVTAPLRMEVGAPPTVRAGEPIPIAAFVTDGGEPIRDLQVHMRVTRPRISVAHALRQYATELADVRPADEDLARGMPEDLARLCELRRRRLPGKEILPLVQHGGFLAQESSTGPYATTITNTTEAGSYVIEVFAKGHSARSGRRVQRTQMVTVLVV